MFDDAIAAAAATAPTIRAQVPLVPGLQLNIDGDYLAYYASGKEGTTPGEARLNAIGIIDAFRTRVGADNVVVHNTAKNSHKGERYLVATVKPYQAQRVGSQKPANQPYLQDWIQGYTGPTFLSKTWVGREADDGIGACALYATSQPLGYAAIATRDKDMRMLPGMHINWLEHQVTRVEPGAYDVIGEDGLQYGLKFFWLQMLMGDAADNIPGLERIRTDNPDKSFKGFKTIGEKGAAEVLKHCRSNEDAYYMVRHEYVRGYNTSTDFALDRFCEQAALLWMRCGNDAAVADFAHHAGPSRINQHFDQLMWDAVERLETRVTNARNQINELSDSDSSSSADGGAAE